MGRTFTLAENLVKAGELKACVEKDLKEEDLLNAKEVMMIGTTLDVLPVTSYEGKPVGDGQVGAISKKLLKLLQEDQNSGPEVWKI